MPENQTAGMRGKTYFHAFLLTFLTVQLPYPVLLTDVSVADVHALSVLIHLLISALPGYRLIRV